jgi:hypothetical protein
MLNISIASILFLSFIFKKYVLFATGIAIFALWGKWSGDEKRLIGVWVLLNIWQAIGAVNLYVSTRSFFPLAELGEIDFLRNLGISFSALICTMFLSKRMQNKNNQEFLVAIPVIVLLPALFLLDNTNQNYFQSLYQSEFRSGIISFGFDDISALLGVAFIFLLIVSPHPRAVVLVSYIFLGLFTALLIGRRTTLLFCLVYIAFISVTTKKYITCVGSAALSSAAYIFFIGGQVRLFEAPSSQILKEGRLVLYRNFYENFDKLMLFGQSLSPKEITFEKITSFHSILLDAAWYGGLVGFICVVCGLGLLLFCLLQAAKKSKEVWIIACFLFLGMALGAPPFSNLMACNICIGLLLAYSVNFRVPSVSVKC